MQSVEQGSTVHDSVEPVPLRVYHQTKLKKNKNEEEDRGSVLETYPLSFFFLVSAPFPLMPSPPLPIGQSKLYFKYPCKGFLLMARYHEFEF